MSTTSNFKSGQLLLGVLAKEWCWRITAPTFGEDTFRLNHQETFQSMSINSTLTHENGHITAKVKKINILRLVFTMIDCILLADAGAKKSNIIKPYQIESCKLHFFSYTYVYTYIYFLLYSATDFRIVKISGSSNTWGGLRYLGVKGFKGFSDNLWIWSNWKQQTGLSLRRLKNAS